MRPNIVDWRITSRCNMNCPFCYGPRGIGDMNLEGSLQVVDKLYELGVSTVCISGGEPLLFPYIREVLRGLRHVGIEVFLSTTGHKYLEFKNDIEPTLKKLSLPLDGATELEQVKSGRTKKGFRDVIEILEYYKDKERLFQLKIATLVTKLNLDAVLPGVFNLLLNYDIDLWKIYEIMPENRGETNYSRLGYDELAFDQAIDRLNKGIKVNPSFQIVVSRRKDRDSGYFIIQPDGTVMIPVDQGNRIEEESIGHILRDPLKEITAKWLDKVNIKNYISNIRLIEKGSMLDETDRMILFELDENPKEEPQEIAKKIGTTREIVTTKIASLFENETIKNIIPIVNLEKLGLDVYLVNIALGAIDRKGFSEIIDKLVKNGSVAWVVESSGKWSIMISVFAHGPENFARIMKEIVKDIGSRLVSYDTHIVYEKYVLGQRYLTIMEHETEFLFDKSRITFAQKNTFSFSKQQHLVLDKIRESKEASIDYIVKQLKLDRKEVVGTVEELIAKDLIKKFQPVFDVEKLGYEWYEAFLKLHNMQEEDLRHFIEYIRKIPQVVHINMTIGAWDLNFEVHSKNKKQFLELYVAIKTRFHKIIREEVFVRINKEHKFSFLVDVVLDVAERNVQ